ncbi:MAG: bifunctional UDP-2,4-diacetamido-2,4,6-trideoxy-beta-L-altropyranose hydrolase/GNAT family N-acetyltransferase, partial [Lentisphaeraceae bacterium]|nr:bifunctional UDP-2,4-diacetamido-2,4,6-trideoxy-beta-L-altropyranose hydrolase/GNAT family N-acetyltransferase [Lentisphaeraceae bacterium]
FRLILDADNVAELMKTSDLAFGASGSSNWERCCLGLPTFLIVTAENQKKIAYEMLKKGCVKLIELESKSELLFEIKKLFLNINGYKAMVKESLSVCDGLGLGRIIQELVPVYSKNGEKLTLRKVLVEDCELLYKWQSHKNTRKYSRNTSIPTFEEHSSWFTSKIKDLSSYFFILESDGQPAGVVRLEFKELLNYEISIYIDPDCYGQWMGKGALQLVKIFFPQFIIHAFVLEENTASQSLFETAGFTRKSPTEFKLNPQKDN